MDTFAIEGEKRAKEAEALIEKAKAIESARWELPSGVTKATILSLPTEGLYLSNVMPLLAGVARESPNTEREIRLRCAKISCAWRALFDAVAAGIVQLLYTSERAGVPAPIPTLAFTRPYSLVAGNDDAIGLDLDRLPDAEAYRQLADNCADYKAGQYIFVTVERVSFAEWIGSLSRERSCPNAKDKKACFDWLVSLRMAGSQPKKKDLLYEEAVQAFGVGPRQFRDCWFAAAAQAPNPSWGSPGPHKNRDG